MNDRLRQAFDSEPVPRDLNARVRSRLDSATLPAKPPLPWGRLASSVALLLIVFSGAEFYAANRTRQVFRTGIADHVHCAIAGAYPRQTGRAEMTRDLGPWAPVLQPVLEQAGGDSVVSAHLCTVNGRNYVHIILRRNGVLISVIATRRGEREGFPRDPLAHVVRVSGVPVHIASLDGYEVAGFNAGAWLGYVVSGLPPAENEQLARRIAPVLIRYTGV